MDVGRAGVQFLSEYEHFRVVSAMISNPGLETSYHAVYRKLRYCGLGVVVDLVVSTSSRVGDSTNTLTDPG